MNFREALTGQLFCRKFRRTALTALLFFVSVQAVHLPVGFNRTEPLWPEKGVRVTSSFELYKTGDLPIEFGINHRIQQYPSSHQLTMTSNIYDVPVSTDPPLDMFPRKYHPVSRGKFLNVPADTPLPTNKYVSLAISWLVGSNIENSGSTQTCSLTTSSKVFGRPRICNGGTKTR